MIRWELPEGWEWTTLGEIADIGGGLTKNKAVRSGGTEVVPLVSVAAVQFRRIDLDGLSEIELTEKDGDTGQLCPGDLLVVEGNGSIAHIGRVAIWDQDVPRARHQNHVIRVRPRSVSSGYLLEWLASPAGRAFIIESATSVSGLYTLSLSKVARLPVPLAPDEDRKGIITRLNALQARITTARAGLDELRQLATALKRAVLDATFRGELTAAWRDAHPEAEPASALLDRLRAERRRRWQEAHPKKPYIAPEPVDPTELPELPEGWCWARLAELIQRVEAGRSPSSLGRPAEAGEYGVIKVSAMTWEDFDPGENKAMLPGDVPDARDTVKAGDLLISRANTRELVGAVVLVAKDHPHLMLSDKSLRLCYLPEIVPTFLLYALRTRPVRAVFEDDSTGNSLSMLNITQQQILSVPIPLAPLAEQQQLAAFLTAAWSSANHALDAARALSADLTTTEHALLTAAFRGELLPPGTCA